MMTKFVLQKIIYWLERVHCMLFGWKKVNPFQRESPQMEKIAKSETISQNHTQTTLGCVTIVRFFRSTIEYHANCKYKNRISSVCFKRVAHGAIVSKDPNYFFSRYVFDFLLLLKFFSSFSFSLAKNIKMCRKPADLKFVFCHILCLNSWTLPVVLQENFGFGLVVCKSIKFLSYFVIVSSHDAGNVNFLSFLSFFFVVGGNWPAHEKNY